MNEVILFTPVGGTDPISLNNMCDGSMMQICRWYHPTKVVMYMSQEILLNEEKDHRYTYCLSKLGEMQNREIHYEIIKRPELTKVQEFDYFYNDFKAIIEELRSSMDSTDQLLLNISSGSPAMKSGLVVLETIEEYSCRLIQVITPERGMNEHTHKGYDVETLWDLDMDNNEGRENRCREVTCPSLSYIQREDVIQKHLNAYDYPAALAVAQDLPEQTTRKYLPLLKLAKARSLLDISTVERIQEQLDIDVLPVKSSEFCSDFEYALDLQNKYRRGEYADFLRAISPLLGDLYKMILKKQFNICVEEYTQTDQDGRWRWSQRKLSGTDVLEVLNQEYNYNFKYGIVYNTHLRKLILYYSRDPQLSELVDHLGPVEETRNMAAHQVIGISDEKVKRWTGYSTREIMNLIKKLFPYAGINIKKECWDSYDRMNAMIKEII